MPQIARPSESQPRSVIVYFQEFKVKEMVLHSAWKKGEIFHSDRRIYFDHDYPAETLAKRKAYSQISTLREKGIRFQTPLPAKLQVFFEGGPATYGSADEAAEDLKKKGFQIGREKTAEAQTFEKAWKIPWQQSKSLANRQTRQELIKEKLQNFRQPR